MVTDHTAGLYLLLVGKGRVKLGSETLTLTVQEDRHGTPPVIQVCVWGVGCVGVRVCVSRGLPVLLAPRLLSVLTPLSRPNPIHTGLEAAPAR